ncbi:Canalicular multispecific organic anion transporter 1 [Homalodisca vitripennis]|nr:Canalicular multispecific organic anion transporter 1 [Homalodisca vitripennis]
MIDDDIDKAVLKTKLQLSRSGSEVSAALSRSASTKSTLLSRCGSSESALLRRSGSLRAAVITDSSIPEDTGCDQSRFNLDKLIQTEKTETGSVKWSVYGHYVKSAGIIISLLTLGFQMLSQALAVLANIWLSAWTKDSTAVVDGVQDLNKRNFYLEIYTVLGFGQMVSAVASAVTLAFGTILASKHLHDSMLSNILQCPMSFFDTTPTGRIVNRFGKDIDAIDNTLPFSIDSALSMTSIVLGVLVVITWSTPIFVVVIFPVGLIYYFLQPLKESKKKQSDLTLTASIKFIHIVGNSNLMPGQSSSISEKSSMIFVPTQKMRSCFESSGAGSCPWCATWAGSETAMTSSQVSDVAVWWANDNRTLPLLTKKSRPGLELTADSVRPANSRCWQVHTKLYLAEFHKNAKVYVATSRQLKRIESVTRSPIFSHFSDSISGASSIRAYGVEKRFSKTLEDRIDANQVCLYPSMVSNRWLSIRLETVGNIFIFFAALFAVLGRDELDSGIVGLSISYALQITSILNYAVRMASEVETNIVSVERIKEYAEVPQEAAWETQVKPNPEWPSKGTVSFKNYQVRYRKGLELVLKGVTFTVHGGEKIGIVGRTGAGKSSLTLCLFRILEAAGGHIYIDGQDISEIGLGDLRSRLTIIPQDPVLFSGTLRQNVDPFEMYSDSDLWQALKLAHIGEFTETLHDGLFHLIAEGGDNLSVGQRQLICLARALLRKTQVLILDEATAAIDLETDDLIQQTIRREFRNCTVLTIAHRLNTIMDSDR